jgi:beta-galactosidase
MSNSDPKDPYLHERYDALHDSPVQRRFKRMAPMPFGVVFLPWDGMTEDDMRAEFRKMKKLGFHNLKQTMGTREWPRTRILKVALEEGIIPFWYGEGGYKEITPELLEELGLPRDMDVDEAMEHPKMVEYQHDLLRKRIDYPPLEGKQMEGVNLEDAGFKKWESADVQLHADPELREEAYPLFKEWVREQYETIDEVNRAWTRAEVGIPGHPYQSWDEFENDDSFLRNNLGRGYGLVHDILRFKADSFIARVRHNAEASYERDPDEPVRAGGEMGLFLPFASRGTDMEGIAEVMKDYGSFYPSLHFAWHFEEVGYEVARCIYMQAALTVDWFKGGWNSTWESTGGPQQITGGKGWELMSQYETPGFTVDKGTMTQLFLSYLAAGYRGAGVWTWNPRRAGWEAGEFALVNRWYEPSERAVRAGEIATAARKHRRELWEARREPEVGILVNWDNEAIWSALSVRGRTHFKHYPVYGRVGTSRALIDANIPFEHVTANDLRDGLAGRYKAIVMPTQFAVNNDLMPILRDYVKAGGRLIADAPSFWFDETGRMFEHGPKSIFTEIFGATLDDFQYSNNVPRELHGHKVDGFILEVAPTTAKVRTTFQTGEPAVTENRLGEGSGVLCCWEAARPLFKPGEDFLQEQFLKVILGSNIRAPFRCENAIVYRSTAPKADHYFFINDGPAQQVHLDTGDFSYRSVSDPVTGESLELDAAIALEAYSGRWLRYEKA